MAERKPCSEDGCEKAARSRGLCSAHYSQALKARQDGPRCKAFDCTEPAWGHGYCNRHYGRMRRAGRLPGQQRNSNEGLLPRGYSMYRDDY